jgi:hypothetical protein
MAASTGATTVLYGTAWDDRTLLERTKQTNLELERRDGIRRHFQYAWQEIAAHNPAYGRFVEGERRRLGENHPLFLTQYCLQPISGGGRLLSRTARGQSWATTPIGRPLPGEATSPGSTFAGGLDSVASAPRRDASVLTVAASSSARRHARPGTAEIVEHSVGQRRRTPTSRLQMLPVSRRLLGREIVLPFRFTAENKSRLATTCLPPSTVAASSSTPPTPLTTTASSGVRPTLPGWPIAPTRR